LRKKNAERSRLQILLAAVLQEHPVVRRAVLQAELAAHQEAKCAHTTIVQVNRTTPMGQDTQIRTAETATEYSGVGPCVIGLLPLSVCHRHGDLVTLRSKAYKDNILYDSMREWDYDYLSTQASISRSSLSLSPPDGQATPEAVE
jgi:hypothetical protein